MVPLTKGGLCWARRVLVGAARRRLDWSRPDPAPLRLTAVDRRVSENFTHTILGRQLTKFRRKRLPGAARARPAGRLQPQQQPGKRRAGPGRPSAVHRGARRRVPGPVPLRRGTRSASRKQRPTVPGTDSGTPRGRPARRSPAAARPGAGRSPGWPRPGSQRPAGRPGMSGRARPACW